MVQFLFDNAVLILFLGLMAWLFFRNEVPFFGFAIALVMGFGVFYLGAPTWLAFTVWIAFTAMTRLPGRSPA